MSTCVEEINIKEEAAVINQELIQGATYNLSLQMLGSDSVATDLTGATAKLTIKTAADVVVLVLTDTSGITLGTTNGFVDVEYTATQTALFPLLRLTYNLDVTLGTEVTPVARGNYKVIKNTNI